MIRFTQSRYTILVSLTNGGALAYNSLSGGFALMEAHERRLYEQVDEGTVLDETDSTVKALAQGGYIVRHDVDELSVIEHQYNTHRFDPNTMILTIAPTLACNFGCDYCFQGQNKDPETMSPEVQDAVVALVKRVAPKINRLHVAWYGGEPLVRAKIVEALSDRFIAICDSNDIHYDAMIVTNGYKLRAEVARSLYVRRVKQVQVTLDGMPEYHDQRRMLLSGKGTFKTITDNLKEWIDEVPLTVSIRVNIDDRNKEDIHGLLYHLAEVGLARKKNLGVYFAPVEAMTEGCHSIADVTMGKSEHALLEADLYKHAFDVGLTGLPYPPRFRGNCSAVRPKGFVIVPNGDIHKCWDTVSWPERRVGTIFNVDALNHDERVLNWLRWTPFKNDTCRNCRILPNCAGACAYKFVHAHDTRGEAAVLPCPSWKYNIKEKLVLRAVRMNIISEEDYTLKMIRTDPKELCADVHIDDGEALPENMQAMLEQPTFTSRKEDGGFTINAADISVASELVPA